MRLLLPIAVTLAACSEPSEPPVGQGPAGQGDSGAPPGPCSAGDASVALGTGQTTFESIDDGDSVVVINGPQGGQHILASVRTWNMTSVAMVHLTVRRAQDDSVVSDQLYRLQFFPQEDAGEGDCAWLYPGMYGYLGFVTGPDDDADFLWREALMSIEVTDNNGRSASDEVRVVPELGEPLSGDEGDGDPPG